MRSPPRANSPERSILRSIARNAGWSAAGTRNARAISLTFEDPGVSRRNSTNAAGEGSAPGERCTFGRRLDELPVRALRSTRLRVRIGNVTHCCTNTVVQAQAGPHRSVGARVEEWVPHGAGTTTLLIKPRCLRQAAGARR